MCSKADKTFVTTVISCDIYCRNLNKTYSPIELSMVGPTSLNTAKDDKEPQIDLVNTTKNDKGL